MTPDQLFLEQLPFVNRAVEAIARRRGLAPAERDDFRSWVHERLIDDDYRILRAFNGDSRIETYLTVVIKRLSLDFLNHTRGKWRPSAAAIRLGPIAVRLETLLVRDQQPYETACALINASLPHPMSSADLDAFRVQLPGRTRRRIDGEDVLDVVAQTHGTRDDTLDDALLHASAAHVRGALRSALESLPADDRLLVRLHFEDGCTIAQIARTLPLEQKPLYSRLASVLASLRTAMVSRGVSTADLDGWVGHVPLEPGAPVEREMSSARTSNG